MKEKEFYEEKNYLLNNFFKTYYYYKLFNIEVIKTTKVITIFFNSFLKERNLFSLQLRKLLYFKKENKKSFLFIN